MPKHEFIRIYIMTMMYDYGIIMKMIILIFNVNSV